MVKYYQIKEVYLTIQGEGFNSGKTAVFCRFTGCNLWNGKEQDRTSSNTICQFCDTDFIGTDGLNGGKYSLSELINKVVSLWQDPYNQPFIVLTGGEPALQVDQQLINDLHASGFYIAIETNGTIALPDKIDWITCSPKTNTIVLTQVNEIKLVYPDINPHWYSDFNTKHLYIQPNAQDSTALEKSIDFCLKHTEWKLSIQMHKLINIR